MVFSTLSETELQVSVAMGVSKVHAAPSSTVLLLLQVMVGGVVSTTVTVWLHWAELPQASGAWQGRVASKVEPQWPVVLVTVLSTEIVALPLLSVVVGGSNVHWVVH